MNALPPDRILACISFRPGLYEHFLGIGIVSALFPGLGLGYAFGRRVSAVALQLGWLAVAVPPYCVRSRTLSRGWRGRDWLVSIRLLSRTEESGAVSRDSSSADVGAPSLFSPRSMPRANSRTVCRLTGPCGLQDTDGQIILNPGLLVVLFHDVPVRFAFRVNGAGVIV